MTSNTIKQCAVKQNTMQQRTIKQPISITGIGLHSGKPVTLQFFPLPCQQGIIFERSDIANSPQIPADALLVTDTHMSSNLVKDNVRIGTVEHLLSAVAGLGIDNLLIKVSAPEIPIMDGSALPFINILTQAGICEQSQPKEFLKIIKPVCIEQPDKWVELLPYHGFALDFTIDFNHPAFEKDYQHIYVDFSTHDFVEQLSQARTFGFLKDIEYLRSHNLALGGSMDNAIVLDEYGVMNEEGLRCNDEFVRHKILDAVGDLYLIGYPLLARFNAYKSGHELNNQLVRAVLADPDCFEIVTFNDNVSCPIEYSS